MSNDLIQKNAELGRFLFCERYTLQPVKNALYIAEGQDLKRGAVVDVNGVLVGTNSLMPYAVLENDCDTRTNGTFASVFVKGEFNFDKLSFANGLSKEDLDNIVYNGSGIGLVIKPYDYEESFSPLMVPAGTSQSNPLMNAEETERLINAMKPIDAMTLRFEFSKKDYNPETAGVGSSGTWTNVSSPTLNVWDWTNDETDWSSAFRGAFIDKDNAVSVIASGDTSEVTKTEYMFAGIYDGNANSGYNLIARNNVIYCRNFDISGTTNSTEMFCATELREASFDLSKVQSISFFYADSYVQKVSDIDCSSAIGISGMFSHCSRLKSVGKIKVSSECVQCTGLFNSATSLEHFGGIIGDTSNLKTLQGACQTCYKLSKVDIPFDFTNSSGLQVVNTFNGCKALRKSPFIGLTDKITSIQALLRNNNAISDIPIDKMDTSNVTNFSRAFEGMTAIKTIPNLNISSSTNVERMFRNCFNVKYGILEMYNKLVARGTSITNHDNCFTDCGINTPEGRAALAQIPASWGGTAAG